MLKFSIEGREELRKALRKDCERMKAAAEDMSGDVPISDITSLAHQEPSRITD